MRVGVPKENKDSFLYTIYSCYLRRILDIHRYKLAHYTTVKIFESSLTSRSGIMPLTLW